MARIASTTTAGVPVDPTGGMTLDALMLRAKEAAARRNAITATPRDMSSPWQVVGGLAQAFSNQRQESEAEDQVKAGRAQLAQLLSGVNPETGATPEQSAQIYSLDPEAGQRAMEAAAEAIRARRLREQTLADRNENRTYEAGREESIDKRELGQDQAAAAATQAAKDAEHARTLTEGQTKIVTGEEAKARGGDPARQYRVSADGTKLEDITPEPTETFRPPTAEEIEQYHLDPKLPYRVSSKTGKPEAVGGSPAVQVMPAEIGARVGMGDVFAERYPEIIADIEAGNVTGVVDYAQGVAGYGRVGEVHRQISSGVDALVRNLTGAGKSKEEAIDYAARYLPQAWDTADSLKSKIVGLQEELTGVRSSVTYKRDAPPAVDDGGTTPPPAATTYEAGKSYTFDDGSEATYKGGPVDAATSWNITKQGGAQ